MYTVKVLQSLCAAVLAKAGLERDSADLVAASLVDAEARGVVSHGVTRLPIYIERIQKGMVDPSARPVVVRESASSSHIDACNALGQVGAGAGMDAAVEKARHSGVGAAGVFNSNHCGTLSFFVRRAAEEGVVAVACSNAPPTMAYHGGYTPAVGTNPFAIAVPRRTGPPITLDAATSEVARGKVILAARKGEAIPDGWALDAQGKPTTDPKAALGGAVLPFAEPKGSGIAMMIDLLCGALVGSNFGTEVGDLYTDWSRPQRVGHFFAAISPEGFSGRTSFAARVERFVEYIAALPAAPGEERVLLPGEPEEMALESALSHGIELAAEVRSDLEAVVSRMGLDATLDDIAARTTARDETT